MDGSGMLSAWRNFFLTASIVDEGYVPARSLTEDRYGPAWEAPAGPMK